MFVVVFLQLTCFHEVIESSRRYLYDDRDAKTWSGLETVAQLNQCGIDEEMMKQLKVDATPFPHTIVYLLRADCVESLRVVVDFIPEVVGRKSGRQTA